MQNIRRFERYVKNLGIVTTPDGDFIQSYSTRVGKIDYEKKEIKVLGYWSRTTTKHINFVSRKFNYKISNG